MNLLSDRVLKYTAWILFALAMCVLISVIYIPVKALVTRDATTNIKTTPVRSGKPIQQNFNCYDVMHADEKIHSGEV